MRQPEYKMPTPSIMDSLGFRLLPPSRDGRIMALMDADERTCQPYGYLSGGASLALAEFLAGVGSFNLCPMGTKPVGGTVHATHVAPLKKGGSVRATATIIHEGKTTHLWNVDVCDAATGRLLSTVRVLNHIVDREDG